MTRAAANADTRWLDWFRVATLWGAAPKQRAIRCTRCDVESVSVGTSDECWVCGRADAIVEA